MALLSTVPAALEIGIRARQRKASGSGRLIVFPAIAGTASVVLDLLERGANKLHLLDHFLLA